MNSKTCHNYKSGFAYQIDYGLNSYKVPQFKDIPKIYKLKAFIGAVLYVHFKKIWQKDNMTVLIEEKRCKPQKKKH